MSYATEAWKRMVRKMEARSNDGNSGFPAKKKLMRSAATALLNRVAPIAKVSLLGIALDLMPHVIASRKKIPASPKATDLFALLSTINEEVLSGNLFQNIFKKYPNRDSWVAIFFFSCLAFQLSAPSKAEYPPRPPSETDEDILARHGLTSTQSGLQIGSTQSLEKKSGKSSLTRSEVEVIVKHFLAAFASTGIGLWFLRCNSISPATRKKHHLSLALYVLFQAGHALWSFQKLRTRAFGKPWQIRTPWMNFNLKLIGRIAEVGLFGWSSYQIMLCWFFKPNLLPPSYEKWITKIADIERPLIEYLRGIRKGTIVEGKHSDFLAGFCRSIGLNPHLGDPYYGVPSCRALHHLDGDNCVQAVARRFLSTSAKAFISLYIPLNLLAFIIKRKKKSEQKENVQPKSLATNLKEKVIYPSARSSAFLGTFVASIFATACLLRNKLGTDRYGAVAGSAVCGVSSILVESPSRRLNLVLYVLPRALTSFYDGKFEKYVPARLLDTPILALSLAIVLTCFRLQPQSVQPPVRALLSWIFSKYSLE